MNLRLALASLALTAGCGITADIRCAEAANTIEACGDEAGADVSELEGADWECALGSVRGTAYYDCVIAKVEDGDCSTPETYEATLEATLAACGAD